MMNEDSELKKPALCELPEKVNFILTEETEKKMQELDSEDNVLKTIPDLTVDQFNNLRAEFEEEIIKQWQDQETQTDLKLCDIDYNTNKSIRNNVINETSDDEFKDCHQMTEDELASKIIEESFRVLLDEDSYKTFSQTMRGVHLFFGGDNNFDLNSLDEEMLDGPILTRNSIDVQKKQELDSEDNGLKTITDLTVDQSNNLRAEFVEETVKQWQDQETQTDLKLGDIDYIINKCIGNNVINETSDNEFKDCQSSDDEFASIISEQACQTLTHEDSAKMMKPTIFSVKIDSLTGRMVIVTHGGETEADLVTIDKELVSGVKIIVNPQWRNYPQVLVIDSENDVILAQTQSKHVDMNNMKVDNASNSSDNNFIDLLKDNDKSGCNHFSSSEHDKSVDDLDLSNTKKIDELSQVQTKINEITTERTSFSKCTKNNEEINFKMDDSEEAYETISNLSLNKIVESIVNEVLETSNEQNIIEKNFIKPDHTKTSDKIHLNLFNRGRSNLISFIDSQLYEVDSDYKINGAKESGGNDAYLFKQETADRNVHKKQYEDGEKSAARENIIPKIHASLGSEDKNVTNLFTEEGEILERFDVIEQRLDSIMIDEKSINGKSVNKCENEFSILTNSVGKQEKNSQIPIDIGRNITDFSFTDKNLASFKQINNIMTSFQPNTLPKNRKSKSSILDTLHRVEDELKPLKQQLVEIQRQLWEIETPYPANSQSNFVQPIKPLYAQSFHYDIATTTTTTTTKPIYKCESEEGHQPTQNTFSKFSQDRHMRSPISLSNLPLGNGLLSQTNGINSTNSLANCTSIWTEPEDILHVQDLDSSVK